MYDMIKSSPGASYGQVSVWLFETCSATYINAQRKTLGSGEKSGRGMRGGSKLKLKDRKRRRDKPTQVARHTGCGLGEAEYIVRRQYRKRKSGKYLLTMIAVDLRAASCTMLSKIGSSELSSNLRRSYKLVSSSLIAAQHTAANF